MKSVGEVMAIGRSFPEALQKAIRMLETGQDGLLNGSKLNDSQLLPSTQRLFAIAQKMAKGEAIENIYSATGIDPWFLYQIKEMVGFEQKLGRQSPSPLGARSRQTIFKAKRLGFSDRLIAKKLKTTEEKIRVYRKQHGIVPKLKHIDTLAAEYPAKTNYLYLTYHGETSEFLKSPKSLKKAIVLGSGPYRIGSSVEFDWCSVTAAATLRSKGIQTIIVNCNPETVSTDYDLADKLYFEELTLERISDILDIEKQTDGKSQVSLVLGFGGQVPNNLAMSAYRANYHILGTSPASIDQAENRDKFSKLLDKLGIEQPAWSILKNVTDAVRFAKTIGYPVLIRPSYVLSGSAMNVAYSAQELKKFLQQATQVSSEHPVVISKFMEMAKEIEIDGVGQEGKLLIYAISEHVENAGVHSGDATIVLPPQRLYLETVRKIKEATKKIIAELKITGPFNIQFLAKDNKILVIELNLRASRSFPFVSKVTGYNFVEIATQVMLGEKLSGDYKTIDLDYVAVKAPQFSFNRIKGADPRLRVEMSSTGEVACFGNDLSESYLKSLLATGFKWPKKSIFLSIGGSKNKLDLLSSVKKLDKLGFKLYTTEHTYLFLKENNINSSRVYKISENKGPSVLDLLKEGEIDLAINISDGGSPKVESDGYVIRRNCIDLGIPLVTNLQSAELLASSLESKRIEDLEIKSWDEYVTV